LNDQTMVNTPDSSILTRDFQIEDYVQENGTPLNPQVQEDEQQHPSQTRPSVRNVDEEIENYKYLKSETNHLLYYMVLSQKHNLAHLQPQPPAMTDYGHDKNETERVHPCNGDEHNDNEQL